MTDDFAVLCLNPGRDPAMRNPLCPVCEDEIRPIQNDAERRFVCGCEKIWKFTFEPIDDGRVEDGGFDDR